MIDMINKRNDFVKYDNEIAFEHDITIANIEI